MNWLTAILGRNKGRDHKRSTIAEDRALTEAEAHFIRWTLAHGNDRSLEFFTQVDRARVFGRCACGCASINLAIDGITHYPRAGMEILCEFRWEAAQGEFECFTFAC